MEHAVMGLSKISGLKAIAAAGLLAGLASVPSVASALTMFSGSYEIDGLDTDPGLVIETAELNDPLGFSLNAGGFTVIDLFDIWTDETAANFGDDFASAIISVAFTFTSPSAGGTVTGTTMAGTIIIGSAGVVTWDGPVNIFFGPGNSGQLQVSLTDEIFNAGFGLGLTPGRQHGATVQAKFKLISEAVSVPAPAPLLLLGAGLIGLGLARRRRTIQA